MLYWDYAKFLDSLVDYGVRRWGFNKTSIEVFKLEPTINYSPSLSNSGAGWLGGNYNPWQTDEILVVLYDPILHTRYVNQVNNYYKLPTDFIERSVFGSQIIDNFLEVFKVDTQKAEISCKVSGYFALNKPLTLTAMTSIIDGAFNPHLPSGTVTNVTLSSSENSITKDLAAKKSLCDCGAQKLGYSDDSAMGHAHWCTVATKRAD